MRKLLLLSLFLLLSGCDLQSLKPDVESVICHIQPERLSALQTIEKRFLTKADERSRILQRALKSKDRAQIALLLSTPLSSTEQLQQAKKNYARIQLNPHPDCPGDSYIDLRNQFTSTLLWMRADQDNLAEEIQSLKTKIDALTEIESDLDRQRGE